MSLDRSYSVRLIKILPYLIMSLVVAAIVLFLAGFRLKREREHEKEDDDKGGFPGYVAQRLHLSPAQKAAIIQVDSQYHPKIHAQVDNLNNAKVAYVSLLSNPTASDSMERAANRQIGTQQMLLDSMAFENFRKMRAVCSESQKPEFDKMVREIAVRRGGGKEHGEKEHRK